MTTLPPGPPQPGTPAPGHPPAVRTVSLGDILVSLGALVGFSFSFAPFVQWSGRALAELGASSGVSVRFNAWSLEMFMVPLTTCVIIALLLAAAGVWVRFALRRDPTVIGFRFRQLEVGLTLFASVVLLAMVLSDKTLILGYGRFADAGLFVPGNGGVDTAWGAMLMLLGALVALVGAVLNHLGLATSIGGHVSQPPPVPPPPPTQPPLVQPPPAPPFPTQREPSQVDPPEPGSS